MKKFKNIPGSWKDVTVDTMHYLTELEEFHQKQQVNIVTKLKDYVVTLTADEGIADAITRAEIPVLFQHLQFVLVPIIPAPATTNRFIHEAVIYTRPEFCDIQFGQFIELMILRINADNISDMIATTLACIYKPETQKEHEGKKIKEFITKFKMLDMYTAYSHFIPIINWIKNITDSYSILFASPEEGIEIVEDEDSIHKKDAVQLEREAKENARLGWFNLRRSLTNGDILRYPAIDALPLGVALTELAMIAKQKEQERLKKK